MQYESKTIEARRYDGVLMSITGLGVNDFLIWRQEPRFYVIVHIPTGTVFPVRFETEPDAVSTTEEISKLRNDWAIGADDFTGDLRKEIEEIFHRRQVRPTFGRYNPHASADLNGYANRE